MAFIYQHQQWPDFEVYYNEIGELFTEVTRKQGLLVGQILQMGFYQQEEKLISVLTEDLVQSSDIEGEMLPTEEVRSSVARRLGFEYNGMVPSDRHIDGMVEMMLDATQNCNQVLTPQRLFRWHAALFPTGYSGNIQVKTGGWRDDRDGPMQVVSGAMGKERVHFQAPPAHCIEEEMERFLSWFNHPSGLAPVVKGAIAHIWFLTIHPFDDGNGRIARAITDMQLTRAEGVHQRYYSLSAQIRKERSGYYEILEKTQRGDLDITDWVYWFLNCLNGALDNSKEELHLVFQRSRFWENNRNVSMNERQTQMVNKLLDDFFGKLTSSKWAKICKCSPDTALRDIQDLVMKNILKKEESGGRSTHYTLIV